ncbi:urea ABC transporter permease subunit UrtB [Vibrio methylphosphonaticus]|uniref:urea ABC transporter permease subunit UrtB n=1 Tax=Vibrio methylphosphonaticus TaxID=2946866 RepID=UPI00202A1181|nr:urea ABC transporter permease subunit UrtB [Vibrio methylphosphonaticus]MCL9776831.1 urea ABC transporter permease subunit UrtB [Vibrio methylphosphonaticus]
MKIITQMLKAVVFLILGTHVAFASVSDRESFSQALIGKNNPQKETAISWIIGNESNEVAKPILTAWLQGDLFYFNDKKSEHFQHLYISTDIKQVSHAQSAWSDDTLAVEKSRLFKKVRVNNKLRGLLRLEIAALGLEHSDPNVRLNAVTTLLGQTEDVVVARLSKQLDVETNSEVAHILTLAVSIDDALTAATVEQRVSAIEVLADYKQSVVFQTLNTVLKSEKNPTVIAAAERALSRYQQSQKLYSGVETIFFGLSLGSVLILAGIGLAITFGVMGVINMAHGELIMIGAYTTYVMQQLMPNQIGLSLILSIPMAFVVSGLVGIAIERSVIRHLYGRPLETLLATFGISLILQQAVRSIFSPLNRSVSTPEWMSGALQINPMLSLTYNRLYIILFCIMVFLGLVMVLKKTPLGLQVRAVSQNRGMARAMGIRSERVDALTFGLGSGVAGVAGVALSQLTNVGPNMGQAYIIDSFMVVVFGGVGNLWGTLVAGLSLGLFNKILEPWAGAVLAKILVLVFIILFIQKRPRGLFPQRGRAAEG